MGDVLTHIGIVKDILIFKHVAVDNFYPIMHLWISTFSLTANMPITSIVKYLTPIYAIFFVISLYFMNKSIFKEERTKVIIASVLGTIHFL